MAAAGLSPIQLSVTHVKQYLIQNSNSESDRAFVVQDLLEAVKQFLTDHSCCESSGCAILCPGCVSRLKANKECKSGRAVSSASKSGVQVSDGACTDTSLSHTTHNPTTPKQHAADLITIDSDASEIEPSPSTTKTKTKVKLLGRGGYEIDKQKEKRRNEQSRVATKAKKAHMPASVRLFKLDTNRQSSLLDMFKPCVSVVMPPSLTPSPDLSNTHTTITTRSSLSTSGCSLDQSHTDQTTASAHSSMSTRSHSRPDVTVANEMPSTNGHKLEKHKLNADETQSSAAVESKWGDLASNDVDESPIVASTHSHKHTQAQATPLLQATQSPLGQSAVSAQGSVVDSDTHLDVTVAPSASVQDPHPSPSPENAKPDLRFVTDVTSSNSENEPQKKRKSDPVDNERGGAAKKGAMSPAKCKAAKLSTSPQPRRVLSDTTNQTSEHARKLMLTPPAARTRQSLGEDSFYEKLVCMPTQEPVQLHLISRRQKETRKLMNGQTDALTKHYYDALDLSPRSKQQRINQISRNRTFEVDRPKTPENYHELNFPDTQECIRRDLPLLWPDHTAIALISKLETVPMTDVENSLACLSGNGDSPSMLTTTAISPSRSSPLPVNSPPRMSLDSAANNRLNATNNQSPPCSLSMSSVHDKTAAKHEDSKPVTPLTNDASDDPVDKSPQSSQIQYEECAVLHSVSENTVFVLAAQCSPPEHVTDLSTDIPNELEQDTKVVIITVEQQRTMTVHNLSKQSEVSAKPPVFLCVECQHSYPNLLSFSDHLTNLDSIHSLSSDSLTNLDSNHSYVCVAGRLYELCENCTGSEFQVEPPSLVDNACIAPEPEDFQQEFKRNLILASELSASRLQSLATPTGQTQPPSNAKAPISIICPLHPVNKPINVECKTCDLIANPPCSARSTPTTRSGTPSMPAMMAQQSNLAAARNSCKTLKCPKCNWTYKYQETLDIHMKEKHSEEDVSCMYCITNSSHPKLTRGETYKCGYKPYRCDICKYSTTTKGNLSIHMQSDKHLNNVQELQAGNTMIDPNTLIHADTPTPAPARTLENVEVSSSPPITSGSSTTSGSSQQTFRCEMCSYETNISRNMRIHTQSDKHQQNMLLFQTKLAAGAALLSAAANSNNGGSQMMSSSPPCAAQQDNSGSGWLEDCDAILRSNLDSKPHTVKLYQCCICVVYGADSVSDMMSHTDADRSQPNASDMCCTQGNFFCNLCQYKTHLKANFQLHTKTDKHAQKLQLINHMREGGAANEQRARYMSAATSVVHVRCNACNELFTNWHKLELHAAGSRHQSSEMALAITRSVDLCTGELGLCCRLCDYSTALKSQMIGHLHENDHLHKLNVFIDAQGGQVADFLKICNSSECAVGNNDSAFNESNEFKDCNQRPGQDMNCCRWCSFSADTKMALIAHMTTEHDELHKAEMSVDLKALESSLAQPVQCPLCQQLVGADWQTIEQHCVQAHKVAKESLHPIIKALLPSTAAQHNSTTCTKCATDFDTCDALRSHQLSAAHFTLTHTREGVGYQCWHEFCAAVFKTTSGLQAHMQALHAPTSCVYKCTHCSMTYSTEEDLNVHVSLHANRSGTRCVLCDRSFRTTSALRRHVENDHVVIPSNINGDTINRTDSFDDEKMNSAEMSEAAYGDVDRPFKCDPCAVAFTKQSYLNNHYRSQTHRSQQSNSNISGFGQSLEKYMDPNRPHKCDICKESFTQKTILQVHNNSVGHLTKAKKLLESQPLNVSAEVLSRLQEHSQNQAQDSTVNESLSNEQQQAMALMASMLAASIQPQPQMHAQSQNVPVITCNECGDTFNCHDQLQEHQQQSSCGTSDLQNTMSLSRLPLRSGNTFKKMLENYGFDVVMQYNENSSQRKRRHSMAASTSAEQRPSHEVDMPPVSADTEFGRFTCAHCRKQFSSIWVLKTHIETVHDILVPSDEVQRVSDELQEAVEHQQQLDQESARSNSNVKEESINTGAPSAKRMKSSPSPSAPNATNNPFTAAFLNNPQDQLQQQQQMQALEQLAQLTKQSSMPMMPGMMNPAWMSMLASGFPFGGVGNGGAMANPLLMAAAAASMGGMTANPFMPMSMPNGTDMQTTGNVTTSSQSLLDPTNTVSTASAPQTTSAMSSASATASNKDSPQRRARTRITDDQLKVLRTYFDINNSPTEQQIEEMSIKSGLAQKVIKHWFRNTLFKERQKNKDSPYNFNIPPSIGIDLDTYEKTGETHVHNLNAAEILAATAQQKPELSNDNKAPKMSASSLKQELTEPSEDSSGTKDTMQLKEEQEPIEELANDQLESVSENIDNKNSLLNLAEGMQPAELTGMMAMFSAQEALRQMSANSNNNMNNNTSQNNSFNPFNLLLAASASNHLPSANSNMSAFPNQTDSAGQSVDAMQQMIASAMQAGNNASNNNNNNNNGSQSMNGVMSPLPRGPSPAQLSASGRRANRTRFSDHQLKSLQDFFERQAYPKDDDLEQLSKQLQLSPRVIVVWFQNARQKARKVYENHPSGMPVTEQMNTSGDRFSKTPGCNFQCKKCSLVFQRYYELIQHQQKQCFKDSTSGDDFSCATSPVAAGAGSSSSSGYQCRTCEASFVDFTSLHEHRQNVHNLAEQNDDEQSGALSIDLSGADAGPSKKAPFRKQCPYCSLVQHSFKTMQNHLMNKHEDMPKLDIDNLPSLSDEMKPANNNTMENNNFLMNMFQQFSDGDNQQNQNAIELLRRLSEQQQQNTMFKNNPSHNGSPLDLSHLSNNNNNNQEQPERSMSTYSDEVEDYEGEWSSAHSHGQRSPSPNSHNHSRTSNGNMIFSTGGRGNSSKRYRTHLSGMQVHIMKHVFNDYKTPSMAECEQLGHEIGLHKRVVQVWFQNARAKERKAKVGGDVPGSDAKSPLECELCDIQYSAKSYQTLQDHIFTSEHVNRVRALLRSQGIDDSTAAPSSSVTPPSHSRSSSVLNTITQVIEQKITPTPSTNNNTAATASRRSRSSHKDNNQHKTMNNNRNGSNNDVASSMAGDLAAMANNYGMMSMGLNAGMPMLFDTSLIGTPVQMLQIPTTVMQQIVLELQKTPSTMVTFTQDGKKISDLRSMVSDPDYSCLTGCDLQVGWACKKCCTVFQSEQLYQNHQQMLCHSSVTAFQLIQTHYQCVACEQRFGKQSEFSDHCKEADHCTKRDQYLVD